MRFLTAIVPAIAVFALLIPGSAQDTNAAYNVAAASFNSWADSGGSAQAADPLQASEFSIMVDGVYGAHLTSSSATLNDIPTDSVGLLVGYRVHLNHWEAVEVEYGYTRNAQNYYTPGTAPHTSPIEDSVTASMQEFIANEVLETPRLAGVFQPFVLAGGGGVYFNPHDNMTALGLPVSSQWRGAFNYGFGFDFHVDHLGMRLEYQGLVFKVPDFGNNTFNVNRWTNIAQPSVGLIFTF